MEEQLELLREIRKELLKRDGNLFLCNIYADIRVIAPNTSHYRTRRQRRQLLKQEIPLFTYENALEFNATHIPNGRYIDISPWWERDNLEDRLAFIDWMIEQYSHV